jgi:hypothetical protein
MKNIITLIYNNLNTILASPQNQLMVLIVLIQAVSIGYFLLGKKKLNHFMFYIDNLDCGHSFDSREVTSGLHTKNI